MRRLLAGCGVLLTVAALLLAADGDKNTEADKALAALHDEYRAAHDAFIKELGSAKDPDAETKAFDDWQPKLETFNERYLELAKKYGSHPAAATALFAVLEHSDGYLLKKTDTRLKVVQALRDQHLQSESITSGMSLLAQLEEPEAEELLRAIANKGATRTVRAVAHWNLGLSLRHTHRRAALIKSMVRGNPRNIERLEKNKGSAYVERMLGVDTAKLEQERSGLLEMVAEDFADVEFIDGGKKRSLGKMAEALLVGTRTLAIGRKTPEAESEDLYGQKVKLSDYKGKVVVLNFWATWCGPCRALIPHERKLVEKMKNRPFAFISVSADQERDTVLQFMARQPMPWTHWWNGPRGDLMDTWHISAFPTIYVIDAKGFLRFEDVREDDLDRAAEKLVREAEEAK